MNYVSFPNLNFFPETIGAIYDHGYWDQTASRINHLENKKSKAHYTNWTADIVQMGNQGTFSYNIDYMVNL